MQPQLRVFTFKGMTQKPTTGTTRPIPVRFLTRSSDAAVLSETGCGTGQGVPVL